MKHEKIKFEDMNDVYQGIITNTLSRLAKLNIKAKDLIKELLLFKNPITDNFSVQPTMLFTADDTEIKYTKAANQTFIKEVILQQCLHVGLGGNFRYNKFKLKIENNRITEIKNDGFNKKSFSEICLLIHEISPLQLVFDTNRVFIN